MNWAAWPPDESLSMLNTAPRSAVEKTAVCSPFGYQLGVYFGTILLSEGDDQLPLLPQPACQCFLIITAPFSWNVSLHCHEHPPAIALEEGTRTNARARWTWSLDLESESAPYRTAFVDSQTFSPGICVWTHKVKASYRRLKSEHREQSTKHALYGKGMKKGGGDGDDWGLKI